MLDLLLSDCEYHLENVTIGITSPIERMISVPREGEIGILRFCFLLFQIVFYP